MDGMALDLHVEVNGMAGEICKVQAQTKWTLQELRIRIEELGGIPIPEQRLLLGCSVLSNESAILGTLLPDTEAVEGNFGPQKLQLSLMRRSPAQAKLLELILKDPLESFNIFSEAPEDLRADKEIVMAAVSNNGHALLDAAEHLKADRDVVLTACAQNAHALQYASADLRSDKDLVLTAAHHNFHCLRFAAESLKADKAWMLTLVQQNCRAIMYAVDALKADQELAAALRGHDASAANLIR